MVDLPMLLGAALTIAFYVFVHQPAMRDTLLHRYTTQHAVEYIIVGFFIWGLMDVLFRVLSFPRQSLALRKSGCRRAKAESRCRMPRAFWRSCKRNPPGCRSRAGATAARRACVS